MHFSKASMNQKKNVPPPKKGRRGDHKTLRKEDNPTKTGQ
jgi:hypothetical protein